jgi:hypothetical protein
VLPVRSNSACVCVPDGSWYQAVTLCEGVLVTYHKGTGRTRTGRCRA